MSFEIILDEKKQSSIKQCQNILNQFLSYLFREAGLLIQVQVGHIPKLNCFYAKCLTFSFLLCILFLRSIDSSLIKTEQLEIYTNLVRNILIVFKI